MTATTCDLVSLISSRICHDLINPLGAIGNGVELLMMQRDSASPELALIAESVTHANARLHFFRLAFGSGSHDHRIARHEVQSMLTDLYALRKLKVAWISDGELARNEVKLALLALLCLESALPYGGVIEISQTDKGWQATADALRLNWDEPLWHRLTAGAPPSGSAAPQAPPLTAQHVQFLLLPSILRPQGRQLQLTHGPQRIEMRW